MTAGIPRGTVLMDGDYGDEAALRDRLSAHGLTYAVGIRPQTTVWWDEYQPAPAPLKPGRGRSRTRVRRDPTHQPIGVLELARRLPAGSYRPITWREGTNAPLRLRFARIRVCAAQSDRPRAEEWLLIEWPKNEAEPTHYWLSTLACSPLVQGSRGDRQNALAHRARLLRAQTGSGPRALRRAQLAWLSSSRKLVYCSLWFPHAGAAFRSQKNSARLKVPPLP